MLKRAVDLGLALVGLALTGPAILVLGAAVAAESPGGAFFGHERVGLHGRRFRMWKLRTMVQHAERRGSGITVGGDDRVTRVGRFLRTTKLDELPQLVNVLVGDMSLVGPRPEVPDFVDRFAADYEEILSVRPGITDEASIRFRSEEAVLAGQPDPLTYYEQVLLPEKIALAKGYVREHSLGRDLSILARTALAVLGD